MGVYQGYKRAGVYGGVYNLYVRGHPIEFLYLHSKFAILLEVHPLFLWDLRHPCEWVNKCLCRFSSFVCLYFVTINREGRIQDYCYSFVVKDFKFHAPLSRRSPSRHQAIPLKTGGRLCYPRHLEIHHETSTVGKNNWFFRENRNYVHFFLFHFRLQLLFVSMAYAIPRPQAPKGAPPSYGKQPDGYFQYVNVPGHKEYEFGWNRGHPNHYISRYEQSKDHRFRTRVSLFVTQCKNLKFRLSLKLYVKAIVAKFWQQTLRLTILTALWISIWGNF